jgi:hypothetical protein
LIIGGVPSHHAFRQHRKPSLSGTSLHVGGVVDGDVTQLECTPESCCQRFNECSFTYSIWSQVVVNVPRGCFAAARNGEHEECDGVGTTRNGAVDVRSGLWE